MTLGELVKKIVDEVNDGTRKSDIFRNKSTLVVILKDHLSMELFNVLAGKNYRTKLFFCCCGNDDDTAIVIKNSDLCSVLADCFRLEYEKKFRSNGIDWYWQITPYMGDKRQISLEEYVDEIFLSSIEQKREEIEQKYEEIRQNEAKIEKLKEEVKQMQAMLA